MTGLSTTNDKKGKHQLVTKIPMIRPSIMSKDIGKQDTLDNEMLAGYNYQIGTPTVCNDINEDASNTLQHLNDESTTRAPPARTVTRASSVGALTRPLSVKVTKYTNSDNGIHGDVKEHALSRDNENHRCRQESDKSRPTCNSGRGSNTRATGLSIMVAKERTNQSLWEITPIRRSRVHKIGHGLQYEGSHTAVVDHDTVLRIHRPDGYKFSPAQVLKNIRMPSTFIDTEQMAVSNAEINTSLSNMPIITGTEGCETDPYMEQCYKVAR